MHCIILQEQLCQGIHFFCLQFLQSTSFLTDLKTRECGMLWVHVMRNLKKQMKQLDALKEQKMAKTKKVHKINSFCW